MIGLFGGTFNPIHLGHLHLAKVLAEVCHLSEVRFIPSATPPHKAEPSASAEQRAHMVALAIEGQALYKLDRQEIERSGVSYTVDTLRAVRAECGPKAPIALLMGIDAFSGLMSWHAWEQYLSLAHIVVTSRPNTRMDDLNAPIKQFYHAHAAASVAPLLQQPCGYIYHHNIAPLAISSSQIRERCQHQTSIQGLVSEKVMHYIQQQGLYVSTD